MAVKHCVWHEASPAEQPFDSASLLLKNNVLHIRYVTQQEARYLNRLLLISWLITYFQARLIPFAFQYIYHKMQSKQSPSKISMYLYGNATILLHYYRS